MTVAPDPVTGPQIGDALGRALLDYLDAPDLRSAIVVERDDGVVQPNPTSTFFRMRKDWRPIENAMPDHVTGAVLDIGAGAGPHAHALAAVGHDVTVLDTSPGAIETCRRRGLTDGFVGTVAEYAESTDRRHDTLLLMGDNLGLIASADGAGELLSAMALVAHPGAIAIGTYGDPYVDARSVDRAYHARNQSRSRMAGQYRLRARYLDLATDWFDHLYMSSDELTSLVAGSGWEIKHDRNDGAGRHFAVLRLVS